MKRQNNPKKKQTGAGNCNSCTQPEIPEATECTDERKPRACPDDPRLDIYPSLKPVADAGPAMPVGHLPMGVRIDRDKKPYRGGKRRKTRKNKKKLGRNTRKTNNKK